MTAPIWTTCPDHDVDHLSDDRCPMCDLVAEVVKWRRRATDPDVLASRPEVQALIAAAYEVAAHWIEAVPQSLPARDEYARHIRRLTPADAIAAREARDTQMRAEGRVAGLREGYLLGFMASGESYNAEYPFSAMDINPESDDEWRKHRDEVIMAALSAPTDQERGG